MGRSRSRSPRRDDRRRFTESRPSDSAPYSSRDYDRQSDSRRDIDYRGDRGGYSRGGGYRDDRESGHRGGGASSRGDRDGRSKGDRRSKSRSRSRGRGGRGEERERSRDRSRPVKLDEFGRVIDEDRRRSKSPDNRGSRRFVPRMRSESPDPEDEEQRRRYEEEEGGRPAAKNADLYAVRDDDDPETAAAKLEMEMMAKMGLPVMMDTTKGKGNVQSDVTAVSGGVRIKPQREHRQYMNRRCGFNKPLPAEATKHKAGIGSSSTIKGNNAHW